MRNLLLFSTVFAVVGSAASGFATDRIGPKTDAARGARAVARRHLCSRRSRRRAWMLFLAGPLVGVALGGTWTVSRVMLVALSPPEKLGEFFGLFSLAGRVSAVLGPALTALLLFVFGGLGGVAYRISIGSLAVIMALGIFFSSASPTPGPETRSTSRCRGAGQVRGNRA